MGELDRFLNIPRAAKRDPRLEKHEPELWYGLCGYWTRDWDKLASDDGLPLCPGCGAPGFVQPVSDWWLQVDAYEADGHPGYRAQVEADEGKCPRSSVKRA